MLDSSPRSVLYYCWGTGLGVPGVPAGRRLRLLPPEFSGVARIAVSTTTTPIGTSSGRRVLLLQVDHGCTVRITNTEVEDLRRMRIELLGCHGSAQLKFPSSLLCCIRSSLESA